jgi:hypothetical protein
MVRDDVEQLRATSASKPAKAMIAPRYVGASTSTRSPVSMNVRASSCSASIPPLVMSTSSGVWPWAALSMSATAARTAGRPSVGEYCSATAASSSSRSAVMVRRMSTGNVSGAGKPPENVMTSVLAASERMAVSSSPPRLVRRAKRAGQSVAATSGVAGSESASVFVVTLTFLDTPSGHLQTRSAS